MKNHLSLIFLRLRVLLLSGQLLARSRAKVETHAVEAIKAKIAKVDSPSKRKGAAMKVSVVFRLRSVYVMLGIFIGTICCVPLAELVHAQTPAPDPCAADRARLQAFEEESRACDQGGLTTPGCPVRSQLQDCSHIPVGNPRDACLKRNKDKIAAWHSQNDPEMARLRQHLRKVSCNPPEPSTFTFELRIQAILLLDDAADSNCNAASPCTTAADIADFVTLANRVFAKASVHFTFDPTWDWTTLVDNDLNNNLTSANSNNWAHANQIADRYPGKIVVFLRKIAPSNFAFPPNTGQRVPQDAAFPNINPNFVAHDGVRSTALLNRQNFAHELGHFLGLYHTHLTWANCYPSAAGCVTTGTDAAITALQNSRGSNALDGDLLSDTPQDPGPTYWTDHGWGICDPTRTTALINGIAYSPDRANVMSYFACNGGTNLSNQQASMIRDSLMHPSRSLLTKAPCFPDFHNLPVGAFQTCFDYWVTRGLWPQTLTVSTDAQRISGSFQSGPYRGEVHHLMSAGAYDQVTARAITNKWTPKSLSETQGLYTAIWEPSSGSDVVSIRDMSESDFNTRWHSLYSQGYIQTDWYIYSDGTLKLSASWTKKASFNGFAAYYGLSWDDLLAKNATFTRQGLRVEHLVAYDDRGTTRFAAIWMPSGANRSLTVSSNGSDYQSTYNQMAGVNRCRLQKLNSFGADSFAALWTCP